MPIKLSYRKDQNAPLTAEQMDQNIFNVEAAINSIESQITAMKEELATLKTKTDVLNTSDAASASANPSSNKDESTISNIKLEVYDGSKLPTELTSHTLALLSNGDTKSLIRYDFDNKRWMHLDNTCVSVA